MKNNSTDILKRYIELKNLWQGNNRFIIEQISRQLSSELMESLNIENKDVEDALENMFIAGYKVSGKISI